LIAAGLTGVCERKVEVCARATDSTAGLPSGTGP
jgi:hypothetical protein